MAAVAGAGGGDEMLLRRSRRRLPLADLTNLSSATSAVTRLKRNPHHSTSPARSASSIGSSTVPRIPTPPPPAALSVSTTKGKDKSTRGLQSSSTHLNKIQKISKPKVKTGGVLPGTSSPPSKNTRKITRKEQPRTESLISPLYASSKTKAKTSGDVLPGASTPPSKKIMKVTSEEQPRAEPLISPLYASSKTRLKTGDGLPGASLPPRKKTRKVTSSSRKEQLQMEEMSCDESLVPSEDFIKERRAYFAEIDAFELVEEFVSSVSDAE
ncbi:hypothetical protein ACQJBY_029698 [Aegilops geniculata]